MLVSMSLKARRWSVVDSASMGFGGGAGDADLVAGERGQVVAAEEMPRA
jgi:hypothetical protein